MFKRRTSISLGGGLLLALTLTLSACPKPDAAEPSDTDSTQVAPIAAPEASTSTAGGACPGPAPAPFDSLKVGQPNQPWSVVTSYVAANPLDTQAAKPGKVKLCAKCAEIEATITPLRNACAIDPVSGSKQTWLLGTVKASQQPTDTANINMFGQGNDSSIVYLLQSGGQTYALYPKGGMTAYVGGIQGGKRWSFSHCNDTTTHGKAAWGKYDPKKPVCQGQMRMTDDVAVPGTTDPGTELTYGWMACISGCCRFYGTQPGNPMEEDMTGPPPGTNPGPPPGTNPGPPPRRP